MTFRSHTLQHRSCLDFHHRARIAYAARQDLSTCARPMNKLRQEPTEIFAGRSAGAAVRHHFGDWCTGAPHQLLHSSSAAARVRYAAHTGRWQLGGALHLRPATGLHTLLTLLYVSIPPLAAGLRVGSHLQTVQCSVKTTICNLMCRLMHTSLTPASCALGSKSARHLLVCQCVDTVL